MANQRKPRPLKSEAAPAVITHELEPLPAPEIAPKKLWAHVTKYKTEFCDAVMQHLANGDPLESFGYNHGITTKTIYVWKKEHPEFDRAIELGRMMSLQYWVKLGKKGAKGSIKFNHQTWQFFMKSMHKWETKDVTLVQNNTQVNIDQSQTAVSISADEVKKAIAADVFVDTKSTESDE